ncbi:phosphoglycerate kinase [Candidatus Falkowbacteria bacterium]|nr:phosphoglycerate kinase [Candidatus Falkowbacteria bacterium]
MNLKTIREVKNLRGKRVLLRVAFDVPLERKGKGFAVADSRRIIEALPTIKHLLRNKCRIVMLSWLGRPEGRIVDKYKMDPVARCVSELIKKPVKKIDDCIGPKVFEQVQKLKPGELLMLENTRFYPEEYENSKMFAALLTHGFDLICFDAFGQIHRVHSSTIGITRFLPTYAGFLLEKEVLALSKIISKPKRPLLIILGGAKISDKIHVLESLLKIADKVLIGGGLANVFFKVNRIKVGESFMEDFFVDKAKRKKVNLQLEAKKLLRRYKGKIVLPVDMLAGNKIDANALIEIVNFEAKGQINQRWKFLDIGPNTIGNYLAEIKRAKTIFFNGPMGVFELDKFAFGTKKIAEAVGRSKGTTIIGGGDTEIVASKYKLEKKISHISTGGGASMAFLAGEDLPVLKKLVKQDKQDE